MVHIAYFGFRGLVYLDYFGFRGLVREKDESLYIGGVCLGLVIYFLLDLR